MSICNHEERDSAGICTRCGGENHFAPKIPQTIAELRHTLSDKWNAAGNAPCSTYEISLLEFGHRAACDRLIPIVEKLAFVVGGAQCQDVSELAIETLKEIRSLLEGKAE